MTSEAPSARRPAGPFEALAFMVSSWRTLSVILLYFSSGLPLGLIWYCIPDWMRGAGVDIRLVGLITLAHAPWTFKMLWSPLMDRYPLRWLGRRRGWIAVTQIALFAGTLLLAGLGNHPDAPWVVIALALAIALFSASQDIVLDAYAVDVLRPAEHGIANGARITVYRVAMTGVSAVSITLTAWLSWPTVCAILATLYLPMLWVTVRAPEPKAEIAPPATLRQAVWLPFLGFLSRHRAVEILAFVLLYKLADNLSQSLLRPFLIDMGYNEFDRGLALGTVGLISTIVGTMLGGVLTSTFGLGHSLWIFGFLQIFSNLGYIFIAWSDVNRPLMYGAMSFETLTTGMGMGAFGALLLRMTQKRFSATQYALFSSLFALPRLAAGPVTGFVVHSVGWEAFFWFTMVAGVPGLVLLARFAPPGLREPVFIVQAPSDRRPLSTAELTIRGVAGGFCGAVCALTILVLLSALDLTSAVAGGGFAVADLLLDLVQPTSVAEALRLAGVLVFAAVCGLLTAAVSAARHGAGLDAAES